MVTTKPSSNLVYILWLYYVESNNCVQFQIQKFEGSVLISLAWFLDRSASTFLSNPHWALTLADVGVAARVLLQKRK